MKKKCDLLGILLAIITGVALLAAMVVRAYFPQIIIPQLNSLTIIILSLAALVLDYYITKGERRIYPLLPLYGVIIFGLLPWLACFVTPLTAVKNAIIGVVALTVVTFLFDSMMKRLKTSPATKVAPIISAFGLYLAAQCLMGII